LCLSAVFPKERTFKIASISASKCRSVGSARLGPGQLAREVRLNGWYIFDYDEKLVFDEHRETLWKRLIDKTELQKVTFPYSPLR
jgi:putative AlgH/UPF0301 family transcriptional regulator